MFDCCLNFLFLFTNLCPFPPPSLPPFNTNKLKHSSGNLMTKHFGIELKFSCHSTAVLKKSIFFLVFMCKCRKTKGKIGRKTEMKK